MNITSRTRADSDAAPLSPERIANNSMLQPVKPINIKQETLQLIEELHNQPYYWRLVVAGLCMIWATNFAVVKTILKEPGIDPAMYVAVRFTLAACALLPQTLKSFDNRDLVLRGMSIGVCIFIAYVGQSIGMLTSTASKSAFISSMHVVWVALVTSILSSKFNLQIWISVFLAVVGAGFIELRGNAPPVVGDLWLLLQPIGFGTGFMLLERLMKHYPDAAGAVSGFKLLAVAIASISWAVITDHTLDDLVPIFQSPIAIAGLLYTGLITTACGVWIQAMAFKRVPATDASIILSSEPLWAAVFASIMLEESLSPADLIGGMFIILSALSNEFNLVNQLSEKYSIIMKEKTDLVFDWFGEAQLERKVVIVDEESQQDQR